MSTAYQVIVGCGALLAGYIVGGIPFGFIVARLKGVHIQRVGSGNIGFSNVFRSVGKVEGILVLIADIAKGLVPVLIFKQVYGVHFGLIAGIAAILGHIFTPFLRFKGGKGVATGLGVFIGLAPFSALFSFLVWLVVVGIFRYISLGSIVAAISLPCFIYFSPYLVRNEYHIGLEVVTILVCLLVIIMHRTNIKRLIRGKEHRFVLGGGKEKSDKERT
jgi:glycerol-3-phosphate acyltransferase PlsY